MTALALDGMAIIAALAAALWLAAPLIDQAAWWCARNVPFPPADEPRPPRVGRRR
jgi:hypothetical protein